MKLRSTLLSALTLFCALIFTSTTATANIDGTWTNERISTRGITKVIIQGNESKIKVYGQCSPSDCDWGYAQLKKTGTNQWKATFNPGFATKTLKLAVTRTGELLIYNKVDYKDKRENSNNSYLFTKKSSKKPLNIAGEWINEKSNTNSITRVVVSANNKTIHIYGACAGDECDWKKTTLVHITGNIWKAYYDQGFATRDIKVAITKNGSLLLTTKNKYNDNREDRLSYDYFKRK